MKKYILFFFLFNSAFSFCQPAAYEFIPEGLHLATENDSALKNTSVSMDSVVFYSSEGQKMGKMQAAVQLQNKENASDAFLDSLSALKIIVIRPKSKAEMEALVQKSEDTDFIPTPAPPFTFTLLRGQTISFEPAHQQNLYVLNFWFSACAPCRAEIPELNKLAEKYKGKKVVFIAITFEDKDKINAFLKTTGFNYQMAVMDTDAIRSFEINSFPTNIIINKEGNIIFKEEGLEQGIFDKLDKVIAAKLK